MAAGWMLLQVGLTVATPAYGADPPGSDRPQVSLVENGKGVYRLEGRFRVDAASAAAWEVLTDYDNIPEFVSSLKRSKVLQRQGNRLLLEQEASTGLFVFARRAHTRLEVLEEPHRTVSFEDTSHRDFEVYRGEWRIEEDPQGLLVAYKLHAKHRLSLPGFIVKGIFKRDVSNLLEEVRQEILRRTQSGLGIPPRGTVRPGDS